MNKVLALYDCRSKQEYIYRTNRVQEITGASELLRYLFTDYIRECDMNIRSDWENNRAQGDFFTDFDKQNLDAEIVYEGGGNLCMIFKDTETYKKFNKGLSLYVLKKAHTVSIIASCVEIGKDGAVPDFVEDRRRLYEENTLKKNLGVYQAPCNVLPFTQVDRITYQPIVKKDGKNKKQYTTESLRKQEAYDNKKEDDFEIIEKEFDKMVDKGTESLLAIIYIDGNNMGEKLKNKTNGKNGYAEGINALREFSKETNKDFVLNPIEAIKKTLTAEYNEYEGRFNPYSLRIIISGGDEITLVCNARAVPLILDTYFKTLKKSENNTACAGVAIFHSHSPFADVYEIAEQCCESGKKRAHEEKSDNKNFIDFHYCHSGITNSLDAIRERQEAAHTCRPYEYSTTWQDFIGLGRKIAEGKDIKVKRSDIKGLSEAISKVYKSDDKKSDSPYYLTELKRIGSRQADNTDISKDDLPADMIYDISIVYDLWFGKESE